MRVPKQKSPYLSSGVNYEDLLSKLHPKVLKDIRENPVLYADLVLDLLAHWQLGTKQTYTMSLFGDIFKEDSM